MQERRIKFKIRILDIYYEKFQKIYKPKCTCEDDQNKDTHRKIARQKRMGILMESEYFYNKIMRKICA